MSHRRLSADRQRRRAERQAIFAQLEIARLVAADPIRQKRSVQVMRHDLLCCVDGVRAKVREIAVERGLRFFGRAAKPIILGKVGTVAPHNLNRHATVVRVNEQADGVRAIDRIDRAIGKTIFGERQRPRADKLIVRHRLPHALPRELSDDLLAAQHRGQSH